MHDLKAMFLLLVAFMTIGCFTSNSKGRLLGSVSTLENIAISLEMYKALKGIYPSAESELEMREKLKDMGLPTVRADNLLVDEWGQGIVYQSYDGNEYILMSCGPDKKCNRNLEDSKQVSNVLVKIPDDLVIKNGVWRKPPIPMVDISIQSSTISASRDSLVYQVSIDQSEVVSWSLYLESNSEVEPLNGSFSWKNGRGFYHTSLAETEKLVHLQQRFAGKSFDEPFLVVLYPRSAKDSDLSDNVRNIAVLQPLKYMELQ